MLMSLFVMWCYCGNFSAFGVNLSEIWAFFGVNFSVNWSLVWWFSYLILGVFRGTGGFSCLILRVFVSLFDSVFLLNKMMKINWGIKWNLPETFVSAEFNVTKTVTRKPNGELIVFWVISEVALTKPLKLLENLLLLSTDFLQWCPEDKEKSK